MRGAEKMQGLKKRTLPDGGKTWRQVLNQERELTWTVQPRGGLLVRKKAHLNGACRRWAPGQAETFQDGASRGQASGYTALILMLMGKNWGFPGKTISMFVLESMDCFSGDLVFPAVLFVIQFSSVFPDYLLIILIFHSYFPVVICDSTKLWQ